MMGNDITTFEGLLTVFLSGAIFALFLASGLFFYKFGRKTGEPFFFVFASACWMLALERLPLLIYGPAAENQPWVFVMRLTAFILISMAFIRANQKKRV